MASNPLPCQMATGFQTARLLIALTVTLWAVLPLRGETPAPARRVGLIFGGSFEDYELVEPLDGARLTRLAAHYEWEFGVRAFTQKTWEASGLDRERLLAETRAIAESIVARVEPKLVRDHRGVVLYAILADEDPFLTSILLSPTLHQRFRETLGDRILVVLLERNRVYLFPATGGPLEEFSPALVEEYRRSKFPVSLEVFLLDRNGFRIAGEIERDPGGGSLERPLPSIPDVPDSAAKSPSPPAPTEPAEADSAAPPQPLGNPAR